MDKAIELDDAETERLKAELAAERKKNEFLNWLTGQWREALEWYAEKVRVACEYSHMDISLDYKSIARKAQEELEKDAGRRASDALAGTQGVQETPCEDPAEEWRDIVADREEYLRKEIKELREALAEKRSEQESSVHLKHPTLGPNGIKVK